MRRLILAATVLALAALGAGPMTVVRGPIGPAYLAPTADFDGTNDYIRLTTTTTPSGFANGKQWTIDFFYRDDGGDGTDRLLVSYTINNSTRIQLYHTSTNKLDLTLVNSTPANVVKATTSVTITTSATWRHVHIAIDTASTSLRHIYIDGTEDASVTWTTYTVDGVVEVASGGNEVKYTIGANTYDLLRLNGALANLWLNDSYLDDLSAFRDAANRPKYLGADGSLPLGSQPATFHSGDGDAFAVDLGSAPDKTVTGALTTTTPP